MPDETTGEPTEPLRLRHALENNPPQLVGCTVGKYEFLELLGIGGMGIVYKARYAGLNRPKPVVVKFPKNFWCFTKADINQWEQEVRILQGMDHPHVVRMLHLDKIEGVPFFVTEFVDGSSLRPWRSGHTSRPERWELFQILLKTVAAVHSKGLVHRDLKPANVLVDSSGNPCLIDFGIALSLGASNQIPTAAGTAGWFAPEQLTGATTAASDVFALGLLYFWLFADPETEPETWRWIGDGAIGRRLQPPTPGFSIHCDQVASRCLHADPNSRPQNGNELLQAIKSAEAGKVASVMEMESDSPWSVVPIGSSGYVERQADTDAKRALLRGESVIRVHGPRRVGKSSLLKRVGEAARQKGWQIVATDFYQFEDGEIRRLEDLHKTLLRQFASQLGTSLNPDEEWQPKHSANINFSQLIETRILTKNNNRLVWILDHVDRLFELPYSNELFSYYRSWQNKRADNRSPWARLIQVFAYSASPVRFINTIETSPFNIGQVVPLEYLTLDELAQLHRQIFANSNPLPPVELESLHSLLAGHPCYSRVVLEELRERPRSVDSFKNETLDGNGPLAEPLRILIQRLKRNPALVTTMNQLVSTEAVLTEDIVDTLRMLGLELNCGRKGCKVKGKLLQRYLAQQFGTARKV